MKKKNKKLYTYNVVTTMYLLSTCIKEWEYLRVDI